MASTPSANFSRATTPESDGSSDVEDSTTVPLLAHARIAGGPLGQTSLDKLAARLHVLASNTAASPSSQIAHAQQDETCFDRGPALANTSKQHTTTGLAILGSRLQSGAELREADLLPYLNLARSLGTASMRGNKRYALGIVEKALALATPTPTQRRACIDAVESAMSEMKSLATQKAAVKFILAQVPQVSPDCTKPLVRLINRADTLGGHFGGTNNSRSNDAQGALQRGLSTLITGTRISPDARRELAISALIGLANFSGFAPALAPGLQYVPLSGIAGVFMDSCREKVITEVFFKALDVLPEPQSLALLAQARDFLQNGEEVLQAERDAVLRTLEQKPQGWLEQYTEQSNDYGARVSAAKRFLNIPERTQVQTRLDQRYEALSPGQRGTVDHAIAQSQADRASTTTAQPSATRQAGAST